MRQFTLARARCGKALGAWPALTMVATRVVRIIELRPGSLGDDGDRLRIGGGWRRRRAMAWPMAAFDLGHARSELAFTASFSFTGKS